jgi:hypothetical protein
LLRESKEVDKLKGSAYTVAGILKGLGMQVIKERDIFNIIKKECFEQKKDISRKIAGLHLYEALAFSLGRSYEQ